jgi:hypothetical protein
MHAVVMDLVIETFKPGARSDRLISGVEIGSSHRQRYIKCKRVKEERIRGKRKAIIAAGAARDMSFECSKKTKTRTPEIIYWSRGQSGSSSILYLYRGRGIEMRGRVTHSLIRTGGVRVAKNN